MSNVKNLMCDIQELLEQGFAPKSVAEKLDCTLSMVWGVETELNELELQKQHEFMSYGDE